MKIDTELGKIKNTVDYKLRGGLLMLDGSDSAEDFRNDFFQLVDIEDVDEEDDEEVANAYHQFYESGMQKMERKLLVKVDELISKFEDR